MKTILLFGAGKSATVLIDQLIADAEANNWKFIIADASKELILSKTNNSPFAEAVELDINNEKARETLIQSAHVVISMMPPDLHFIVAKDCVEYRKHLLTASYLDDKIKSLRDEISNRKLLFLCEMGLDPGIDHMSAHKLIDEIKAEGGVISSFKSHCGGLVAPESDDNPWHYKISWNPRNIVMAGKAGAVYKLNGQIVKENYEALFKPERGVRLDEALGFLSWYPNRDSLPYIDLYGLHDAETFLRTTLRYPDFMYGWNNIVELQLTDETKSYETDGMSLAGFFKQHFEKVNFAEWLTKKLEERLTDGGENKMHEADITLKQLIFLGMNDDETLINKGLCSTADVLQFAMERKLALKPEDKDMIVMLHELEFRVQSSEFRVQSYLIVKGEDSLRTAMAKTVGLPLAIAAKLILNETIKLRGLHIPTHVEIYEPVLKELEEHGIRFVEKKSEEM